MSTRRRSSPVWALVWAMCVLSAALTGHARAQTAADAPPSHERVAPVAVPSGPLTAGDVADAWKFPRTVAVLPFKSHLVSTADLFAAEGSRRPADDAENLQADVARLLAAEPYTVIRDVGEVRRLLSDELATTAATQSAQQAYRVGLELYLSLAPARATDKLAQAVRIYRDTFHDVFDPRPLADAQFMLGVALVDSGRTAEGHIALKDAFALQPDRRFRANFFPPTVATALQSALTDFLQTADPFRAYGDPQRMAQVARRLGVRWLVVGAVRPTATAPELWVAVFSAERRMFEAELRVPLNDVVHRLQPFFSRWSACAAVGESRPSAPLRDTVRVDMSGVYAPFLRQPTRRDFHSMGFAVGISHEFRSNLEWFTRLALHTSLPDPYRDLLRSFNSVRAVAGLGATVRSGPVRLYAQAGLDAHLLGSFQASTDPDCKLFGVQHPLCTRPQVLDLDQQVLIGVNTALGAQLHLGRDFLLALRLSLSNYFLPLDGTDRLNLPLGAELGLGYRF